jgi:hypothetical protein
MVRSAEQAGEGGMAVGFSLNRTAKDSCAHRWVEVEAGGGYKTLKCELCEASGDYGTLVQFGNDEGTKQ